MKNLWFALLLAATCACAQDNRYCSPENVWTGNTSDGPAQLPQRCINTALANTPAPGLVVNVPPGPGLLAAYKVASCGTVLQLAHGQTYTGSFAFPPKGCDNQHWIWIKSDGTLPPEGTRVTANDQPQLANLSFRPNAPPMQFGDHIRIIGVAFTKLPGNQLVAFATGNAAQFIIFDRVRMLGNPKEETRRGFTVSNGQYLAVIDSDFEEFHCIAVTGACIDSQAVSGGTGTGMPASGPVKIVNNTLSAAAENILFGGDAGDGCGPNDVEIRRNYMFKPMSWNPNDPNFIGTKYVVKNLFELKNGCRILVEGNVMQNSWGGFSQTGEGISVGPKNQTIGSANVCPLCTVTDVVFRYNKISNVGSFEGIASGISDGGGWSLGQHRSTFHDVVIDGIQYPTCYQCSISLGLLGSGYKATNPPPSQSVMSDVLINHITQVSGLDLATGAIPGAWLQLNGPPANNPSGTPQINNVSWINSISLAGMWGTIATGGGTDNCAVFPVGSGAGSPTKQLTACFVGTSTFSGNVFVQAGSQRVPADWPAGNNFVADWPELALVNYNGSFGGDYHLTFASPMHAKGLDGRDPGADIDMVNLFTQGVQ
jgi:hypothetical protein